MTKEEIISHIEQHCVDNLLDDLVHEAASVEASNVNNCGIEGQVEYLLASGFDLVYLEGLIQGD